MAESSAYIGYRSPRRAERNNDREAAKNAPLALLRGWIAGTAGLPGDLEGLIRMLPGIKDETPALPTTEFYKEWLPLRGDSPTERAFTELGSLTGGAGVGTAARAAKTGVSAGARGALSAVQAAARNASVPRTLSPQAGVIKMKGGNWLDGSVEDALKSLKSRRVLPEGLERYDADRWVNPYDGEVFTNAQVIANNASGDVHLNSWIDKKLARYVKNEMATPEDPVRALAERGVLHYEPRPTSWPVQRAMEHRAETGFPTGGYSENDLARNYETLTDSSIRGGSARSWLANASEDVLSTMPWVSKVPPETMIYEKNSPGLAYNLGFDHLVDELRNATNPESGLPRELLWKYSDLDKVTVPQAVERVSKINDWRAAQKAEADLLRANNAATVLHKEYPEAGYKWVELKSPGKAPVGWKEEVTQGGMPNLDPDWAYGRKALEDALKYEGDTMGHCVGGYCDDVASGKSRIYSLRDRKGQPHTTIEVAPQTGDTQKGWEFATGELVKKYGDEAYDMGPGYPEFDALITQYESSMPPMQRIVQIKGKQNKAPNPEYLPYVQDFVRSGKWSDVGDLHNAGLRRARDAFNELERKTLLDKGHEFGDYLTADELKALQSQWGVNKGFAAGGLVTYNPADIDDRVSQLLSELESEGA